MTKIQSLVRQSLAKFPDHPSRTIARYLHQKHPAVFKSVDQARNAVTYERGRRKPHAPASTLPPVLGTPRAGANPLPPPLQANDSPWEGALLMPRSPAAKQNVPLPAPIASAVSSWGVVHVDFETAGILSDIHLNFHDSQALEVALEHLEYQAPDTIILLGDVVDFYAISFFQRDPELRNLVNEVKSLRQFLQHLRGRFPKARIIYKDGNHEERLQRYVWERIPEISALMTHDGVRVFSMEFIANSSSVGVELVGDKRPILLGEHLHLLHGHEFRKPMTNPVNPARGLFLRTGCNAMCGDLHQTSQHTESGLAKTVSTYSIGCLCELHPAYMPLNKWNHGFATVRSHRGAWAVENHKIIAGQVV